MLSPRKFAAGKKFLKRWQDARKRNAKRKIQFESLEKRELLANDFSPAVLSALATIRFPTQAAFQETGELLQARYGNATIRTTGAGESTTPLNTNEAEPNGTRATANYLPLGNISGKNAVVNVSGQMNNLWDEDFFAFDLKAGDILNVRSVVAGAVTPGLTLYNSQGRELLYSKEMFYPPAVGRPIPDESPLFSTGNSSLSYIIDTDGRYYLSVNDAALTYSLNLRTYRNTIEQEPIGTKQKLFIDFDGAFLRSDVLGLMPTLPLPQMVRIPAMSQILPTLGLTMADEEAVIRNILKRVEQKIVTNIAQQGYNGWYSQTGIAGQFDIEILNSWDNPDVWGQPNVARMIVGGNSATLGLPAYGVAESIDIGNFNREDTALAMVDLAAQTAVTIPLAGNATVADAFAQEMADTIVHELGHLLGVSHTNTSNNVITIMDGYLSDQVGPDGLFGSADDRLHYFTNDEFSSEVTAGGGVNNTGAIVSWALSTGTVGRSITGSIYNDINRNGRQDSGEVGLVGWEVYADVNGNGVRELGEPKAVTGAGGAYTINVASGVYNLRVTPPEGWVFATAADAMKSANVTTSNAVVNFGAAYPVDAVTGYKWLDVNGNGVRDAGEPGIAGVYIYLDLDGDKRPDIGEPAALTKSDGSYVLTPPRAGTYTIREVMTPGIRQTFPGNGIEEGHTVVYNGVTPLKGYDFGNSDSADWGDAPSTRYPTLRSQNGAFHSQSDGLQLGLLWDAEQDGQPTANADGDNLNGEDDEDGVAILTPIVRGDSSNILQFTVVNTTGTVAYLQGWIDFDGVNGWTSDEKIISDFAVTTSGVYNISFTTPINAVSNTFARFRLSHTAGLGPTGGVTSGEVEDYPISIVNGPRTLLQPDTASVSRNSIANPIDVLQNDFSIPGDTWTITGVSSSSRGGRVVIDTANARVLYTPPLSFIGLDEFTYTAVSTTGHMETARVTVSVSAQFVDPVSVDDSFDVPENAIGYPLNVLANDIEGRGGALVITSVSVPSQNGVATIGSGGQSIRYTPRRNFGGTETITYTATDATGKSTTSKITINVYPGTRDDDLVEFSFKFFDVTGQQEITAIRQGEQFVVEVSVRDLRELRDRAQVPPLPAREYGVFAAYLDVLYSAGLVAPSAPNASNPLDFDVQFSTNYPRQHEGTAAIPGIIDEFGAITGDGPLSNGGQTKVLGRIVFNATNPGLAEFIGDPSDVSPATDVLFYDSARTAVPVSEIRFGRASLEVVAAGVNFPYAVDDSTGLLPASQPSIINVLANDISGSQPPVRITSVTQPASGQVQISDNGTPSVYTDDRIVYTPNTNFSGTDSFTYTITDNQGFTSTATVTVQVGTAAQVQADDVADVRLVVTDLNGTPIDQVVVGSQFQLRGYVQDLRTNPTTPGIFAAYQDILYNSNLVSVNTQADAPYFQVVYDAAYSTATSGDIRIPGVINEIGSAQTNNVALGSGEKLQFTITLTANATGVANFIGDPADIKPFHDTLFYDPTNPLTTSQIRYHASSVTIVSSRSIVGSGEGFTNPTNAFDVNNDGYVSPIDVLIVINTLNRDGSGPLGIAGASGEDAADFVFVDVDGDGHLTPLDVLSVVNYINSAPRVTPQNPIEGEGELVEIEETPAAPLFVANSLESNLVEVPFLADQHLDSAVAALYAAPEVDTDKTDDEFDFANYFVDDSSDDDEDDTIDFLALHFSR